MNYMQVPPQPFAVEQWNLTSARINEWLTGAIFTFRWWILLALLLITVFLWWKLIDRTRLTEILLYSFLIIVDIIVLDEMGEELCLWYYPVDLFFLFPPTTAIDLTCMPLVYMVIYQRFNNWKGFLIANVIMATVFCFIFEPIFVAAGLYTMLKWKSYYGFPIYIFIALSSKYLVDMISKHSKKSGKETGKIQP